MILTIVIDTKSLGSVENNDVLVNSSNAPNVFCVDDARDGVARGSGQTGNGRYIND